MALPGPVFGVVIWELHNDIVAISGLIALHWYATDEQPSVLAGEAAKLMLRRVKLAGEGSDLTNVAQKSVFRLLFDFVVRFALNPRFADGTYSATVDSLVRFLTNLASRRMVNGRIYGGVGIDGFETLRLVLLAAMAANLPKQGDDGISALIDAFQTDELFSVDKRVRDFIWTVRQLISSLRQVRSQDAYIKAAQLFDAQLDIEAASSCLEMVLTYVADTFDTLREDRLALAPLDEDRIGLVRRRMSDAILAYGPAMTCFQDYTINRRSDHAIPRAETEFGVVDRGQFTLPQLSAASFDELPAIFVEVIRSGLANHVWRDLYARPKRVIAISIANETDTFWRRAVAEAPTVGPAPILLVPYATLGDQIAVGAMMGNAPQGMAITHENQAPSGDGTGYLGSVNGIRVYSSPRFVTQAILCSSRLLRELDYGVVHGQRDVADFALVPTDHPEQSRVRLWFAQQAHWADHVFVEFDLREPPRTEADI